MQQAAKKTRESEEVERLTADIIELRIRLRDLTARRRKMATIAVANGDNAPIFRPDGFRAALVKLLIENPPGLRIKEIQRRLGENGENVHRSRVWMALTHSDLFARERFTWRVRPELIYSKSPNAQKTR